MQFYLVDDKIIEEVYEKIVGKPFDIYEDEETDQQVTVAENHDSKYFTQLKDIPVDLDETAFLDVEHERSVLGLESQYCYAISAGTLYEWADLSNEQKSLSRAKAIAAFDENDAWDRASDLSEIEWKNYQFKSKNKIKLIALTSRWVDAAKVLSNGELIGKSRLATRGFDDRSWESMFYSSSPTVGASTIRISETLGIRDDLISVLIDFSDAFFLGKYLAFSDERQFWMKVVDLDNKVIWRRLKKEVPGCKGAAASWYRTLCECLIEQDYVVSSLDKGWFLKHSEGRLVGSIPLHVDDVRGRFDPVEWKNLEEKLRQKNIKIGSLIVQAEKSTFCGMQFSEFSDGRIEIDQDAYIAQKLTVPDKIVVKNDDELLDKIQLKSFATYIGKLIWVIPTQNSKGFEISMLARRRDCARHGDYKRMRKLIVEIRDAPDHIVLPKMSNKIPIKLVGIVDAGGGEEVLAPLKRRDQQCSIIGIQEASQPGTPGKFAVLSFSCVGIKRVCHSSFDIEATAVVFTLDLIQNYRILIGEYSIGPCPHRQESVLRKAWSEKLCSAELHSDAMSLVKVVKSNTSHSLSRRRSLDVEDIRQALAERAISGILHILGETNPADVGTKVASKCRRGMQAFLALIAGWYEPRTTELQSFDEQINYILECFNES